MSGNLQRLSEDPETFKLYKQYLQSQERMNLIRDGHYIENSDLIHIDIQESNDNKEISGTNRIVPPPSKDSKNTPNAWTPVIVNSEFSSSNLRVTKSQLKISIGGSIPNQCRTDNQKQNTSSIAVQSNKSENDVDLSNSVDKIMGFKYDQTIKSFTKRCDIFSRQSFRKSQERSKWAVKDYDEQLK